MNGVRGLVRVVSLGATDATNSVRTLARECVSWTVRDLALEGADCGHPCRRELSLSVSSLVARVGETVLLCLMKTARGVR